MATCEGHGNRRPQDLAEPSFEADEVRIMKIKIMEKDFLRLLGGEKDTWREVRSKNIISKYSFKL
jgi:hypothetical protein